MRTFCRNRCRYRRWRFSHKIYGRETTQEERKEWLDQNVPNIKENQEQEEEEHEHEKPIKDNTEDVYYNILGQKVTKDWRGIVITNKKKYIFSY